MSIDRLLDGMELTTAEILYHLPDYYDVLQLFLWQDYDRPPHFPRIKQFLRFWESELDGKLHSIKIVSAGNLIIPQTRMVLWMEKV